MAISSAAADGPGETRALTVIVGRSLLAVVTGDPESRTAERRIGRSVYVAYGAAVDYGSDGSVVF
ncbi:hypothetical protein IWX64_002003 [Arthrobacter sp. CAN_A212]|uniref:hypothetical protein n=1 Tax=Arthrobacter sp. CAN_A212 TaxID=2787719 RepID=UPI0018CB2484